jgi:hypothetical protein
LRRRKTKIPQEGEENGTEETTVDENGEKEEKEETADENGEKEEKEETAAAAEEEEEEVVGSAERDLFSRIFLLLFCAFSNISSRKLTTLQKEHRYGYFTKKANTMCGLLGAK